MRTTGTAQGGGRTYANVSSIKRHLGWVEITLRCHGRIPNRLLRQKPSTAFLAWGRFEHEWAKRPARKEQTHERPGRG